MAEPKGVGHSPFKGLDLQKIVNEILTRKLLTQREARALKEKLTKKQKLTEIEANKMEKILEMATSGRKFSPQELLALQTGMHRYTHELELVTKIVEKTTEGVKKTMQTEV